ncbi:MAG: M14 family zinc carboxypeptidase [Actinomycetota bacterium]|jgi:protein MpaA
MPSTPPLPPELERLNRIYIETCEAFDNNEISSETARTTILGLRAMDAKGRTWVIDPKKSGSRASFKQVETVTQLDDEFSRMNRTYQETCAQFDSGLISATQARMKILAISYTDETGQTWRVDTERSGSRASFTSSPAVAKPEATQNTQPIPVVESETREIAITPEIEQERELISRRNFLSDLSVKSIALGVLSAGVLYEAAHLFTGNSNSTDSGSIASGDTSDPAAPAEPGWFKKFGEVPLNTDIEFGRSVQNVPLTFYRRQSGSNGARVLVIGCIHGDEFVGNRVVDILRDMPLEGNIDLWMVRTMNPDGQQLRTRQNANGVDLNRNFPGNWQNIGKPGSWQYAGADSASEPEVQSMVKLGELVKPQFVIWYHQDYFRIGPGTGHDGDVRTKYASLVGLPLLALDCLCGYTGDKPLLEAVFGGTGANWAKSFQGPKGVSMTVEFGKTLSEEDAQRNAQAVVAVTNEFF